MRRSIAVGVVSSFLAVVSAAADGASPIEGRIVVRGTDAPRAFEPGDAERYLAAVEELLGVRVPGAIDVYAWQGPEEIAARLGPYTPSMAFPLARQVHVSDGLRPDHVVRVVAGQAGHAGPFFEAGLAVALGARRQWHGQPVDAVVRRIGADAATLLAAVRSFNRQPGRVAVPVAGSFVADLLEQHGGPAFTRFLRLCHGEAGLEPAFQAAFGATLEAEALRWATTLEQRDDARERKLVFASGARWAAPRIETRVSAPQRPLAVPASAP